MGITERVIDKVKSIRRRPRQIDLEEYLAKLRAKGLKPDGTMNVDPRPMRPPVGYKKQPSMVELVREAVRSERLAQEARDAGHETFEESEDFDVGDEPDQMRSPWENEFDPPLVEILKAGEEVVRARDVSDNKPSGAPAKPAPVAPGNAGDPPPDGPEAP